MSARAERWLQCDGVVNGEQCPNRLTLTHNERFYDVRERAAEVGWIRVGRRDLCRREHLTEEAR